MTHTIRRLGLAAAVVLVAGLARADALDDLADDARATMPEAEAMSLEELLGPEADEALPELTDLPPATSTVPDPDADPAAWEAFELAQAGTPPPAADGTGPADATGIVVEASEPPAGWVWHELQGTRFAAPGDMQVMEQDDDNIALFRGDLNGPAGEILMIGIDSSSGDTWDEALADLQSEGGTVGTVGTLQLPGGHVFDWADYAMSMDGIEMAARMIFSRDRFGEDQDPMLIAIGTVGDVPPVDAATSAAFLASIQVAAPTATAPAPTGEGGTPQALPAPPQALLGGLVSVPVPAGWSVTETAPGVALIAPPDAAGTVRFLTGTAALAAVATIPAATTPIPTWQDGGAAPEYDLPDRTVVVWETCPRPGEPLVMEIAGPAEFRDSAGVFSLWMGLRVAMPAGSAPCGEIIAPGQTTVNAGNEPPVQPPPLPELRLEVGGVAVVLPGSWMVLFAQADQAMLLDDTGRHRLLLAWLPADVRPDTGPAAEIAGEAVISQRSVLEDRVVLQLVTDRSRADGRHLSIVYEALGAAPDAPLAAELAQLLARIDWGPVFVQAEPDGFTPFAAGYATYRNARFGFEITYPDSYFTADPAPAAGDGRRFASADGTARFDVVVRADVAGQSIDTLLAGGRAGLDRIVSESAAADGYLIAARRGAESVLRRLVLNADGLAVAFEMSWPTARDADFTAVATYVAQSLTLPGEPPSPTDTPQTSDRAELFDAAAKAVRKVLGVPVSFRVSVLRVQGDWAYLQGTPVNPDGTALDWSATALAREWAAGHMSDTVMVLLRRQAGTWVVADQFVGPTDVAWYGWVEEYGLSETLFLP